MCAEDQAAFQHLQVAIRADPVFRRQRLVLAFFASLVLLAQVAVTIVLPVLYVQAAEYMREFRAVDKYMSVLAESMFQVSLQRAQAAPQSSMVLDMPGILPWYTALGQNPTARMQELASQLEFYHRCIVYGCAALNIKGVSISATLTDFYYGATGADRRLKSLISSLRNNQLSALLPLYDTGFHFLSRQLPRLYVDNFSSWMSGYIITIAVCCSLLMAAVLGVGVRYYRQFVMAFQRDVRRYRSILQLLPAAALAEVPFARKFLATTAWVELATDNDLTADAVMGNDDDELNQV